MNSILLLPKTPMRLCGVLAKILTAIENCLWSVAVISVHMGYTYAVDAIDGLLE
jgi:hypothetical protein